MRLLVAALGAVIGMGTAQAGPLDGPPQPEIFQRPEDQQRARLLMTPCTKADVEHGCSLFSGHLSRDIPCTYRVDAMSVGSIPTDRCYKMQAPRRFRGVWVDAFEGQAFIPAGATPPHWPEGDARSPGWRQRFDKAQAATIWLDVDRVKLGHDFKADGGRRMLIDFVGRETAYPGAYGHMGLSGNEIIVDRVISLMPIQ